MSSRGRRACLMPPGSPTGDGRTRPLNIDCQTISRKSRDGLVILACREGGRSRRRRIRLGSPRSSYGTRCVPTCVPDLLLGRCGMVMHGMAADRSRDVTLGQPQPPLGYPWSMTRVGLTMILARAADRPACLQRPVEQVEQSALVAASTRRGTGHSSPAPFSLDHHQLHRHLGDRLRQPLDLGRGCPTDSGWRRWSTAVRSHTVLGTRELECFT